MAWRRLDGCARSVWRCLRQSGGLSGRSAPPIPRTEHALEDPDRLRLGGRGRGRSQAYERPDRQDGLPIASFAGDKKIGKLKQPNSLIPTDSLTPAERMAFMQRRIASLCRPTNVATSAAWVLRYAAVILGLICHSTILQANAADLSQRMRLPVGQYWIGAGTHAGAGRRESPGRVASTLARVAAGNASLGYRLPVYWIDVARDPPTSKTPIAYFSGNAEVLRYRKGKLLGKKRLNEAVSGPDPWLTFTGIDRPDSAPDKPRGSTIEIAVVPQGSQLAYRLNVPGLALGGEDRQDVESGYAAWTGNAALMQATSVLEAFRKAAVTDVSANSEAIAKFENARQDFENNQFGTEPSGISAAKPNAADALDVIDGTISRTFDIDADEVTETDRLDWVTLVRGRVLPGSELKAFSERMAALQIAIAKPYPPLSKKDAQLLSAYARFSAQHKTTEQLAAFRKLRSEQNLPFSDALRQSVFALFDETAWTSGHPELALLNDFDCAKNGEDRGKSALTELRVGVALMRASQSFFATRTNNRPAKVTIADDKVCVARILPNAVERRVMPAGPSAKSFLERTYGGENLVVSDDDEESANALTAQHVQFQTLGAWGRRLSARAFSQTAASARRSSERKFVHLRRRGQNSRGVDVTVLDLESGGDASVARMPDGSLLMIGSGPAKGAVQRSSNLLTRTHGRRKPAIRIAITHSDQEHIDGLKQITDAGFEIKEMLIGRSDSDGNTIDGLVNIFAGGARSEIQLGAGRGVTHFVRKGVSPLFSADLRRTSEGGDVESWSLHNIAGATIDVHHMIEARSEDDGGLLVRIGYKGLHWLLCDDLSDVALAAFVNDLAMAELSAGILKWPHHLWLPAEQSPARRNLAQFLSKVAPHTIVFSSSGDSSQDRARFLEIKRFATSVLGNGVAIAWTGEMHKSVVIQAKAKALRPTRAQTILTKHARIGARRIGRSERKA